jgi:outer membrane biosynthesis protein TonB
METTTTEEKRKSFLIATCIYAVLLLIMFFIRFWPPSDAELAMLAGGGGGGGVEVNFGDTDFGSGDNFKSEVLDVKDATKQTPSETTPEEDIISQDADAEKNDVVIPKHDIPKTPKPVVVKDVKPVIVKPKVNTTANSALDNIIKGNKGGDGNSGTAGNQGSSNGSINSSGYGNGGSGGGTGGGNGPGNGTGTGPGSGSGSGGGNGSGNGLGNGSGYSLAGRKALSKPAPVYNCNEEGVVVVQITVDKNGNVIEAKPGARGTTNTASCLASQARIAAMKTKWEASPTNAEKQVGTIKYNFSLKD